MTPAKNSPDETTITDGASPENSVEPNAEAGNSEPMPRKTAHQPRHPKPKEFYKGQKIGLGPRGSRRSMGKR